MSFQSFTAHLKGLSDARGRGFKSVKSVLENLGKKPGKRERRMLDVPRSGHDGGILG